MIQQMWEALECPIRDGIYFADDRVIPLEISTNWKTDCPTIFSKPLPTIRLSELKEFQENRKTYLAEICDRSYPESDLCVRAGECANGAEGFVAVSEMNSKKLVGMAYVFGSNAFYKVELVDGNVVAVSTHDHVWKFPLLAPESLSIDCTKDVGWMVQQERQPRS
jgi:hypothetical protein